MSVQIISRKSQLITCSSAIQESCSASLPSCAMKNFTATSPVWYAWRTHVSRAASLYGRCSLRVGMPMKSLILGLRASRAAVTLLSWKA